MIYHPDSPYKGQMVRNPVELLDIYPTIIDLLIPPYNKEDIYSPSKSRHERKFRLLEGKSLAPLILGKLLSDLFYLTREMLSYVSVSYVSYHICDA